MKDAHRFYGQGIPAMPFEEAASLQRYRPKALWSQVHGKR